MISSDAPIIYSIGHSDHALEAFIALLRQFGITTLVDVRSQPYSRWVPSYNRETLARALEEVGLVYVFMGDHLGGRPADGALYASGDKSGRPDYARVAASPIFQAGLERLIELSHSRSVAMMCSEGDYRECHRSLLITPELLARGVRVIHIAPDGSVTEARPEPKQLSLF